MPIQTQVSIGLSSRKTRDIYPSIRNDYLCQWCKNNVFDTPTLAAVNHATFPYPSAESDLDSKGSLHKTVDVVAHFANRSYLSGYRRSIRQNFGQFEQGAGQGCVFCSLLKAACDQTKNESWNQPDADIDFDLAIEAAWDWSSISINTEDGKKSNNRAWFRIYPMDPRFISVQETGELLPFEQTSGYHLNYPFIENADKQEQEHCHLGKELERSGKVFRTLLDDCILNHPECKGGDVSILPSMLLDLSGTINAPSLHLVMVADVVERPIKYVCLSYCWGGPQSHMTTSNRVESYLEGITATSLPATLLDAIRVTLSLGFKYLWVDSLCIVQDREQEKVIELNKMSSIYAGATCTICAMSAESVNEGFLHYSEGNDSGITTTQHAIIQDTKYNRAAVLEMRSDSSAHSAFNEYLLTRAWTLQEGLLSPRMLLYFSEGQRPALTCSKCTVRLDGGHVSQIPKSLMGMAGILKHHSSQEELPEKHWELMDEWCLIVKNYSTRARSFQSDTMPAIAGIVAEWENRVPALGPYKAGLWSHTMRDDLIWRPQRCSQRASHQTYIAPSWSWASRCHPVYYQYRGEMCAYDDELCRILSCEVRPANPEFPNGAIASAELTLECVAEEVHADVESGLLNLSTSDGSATFIFDDEPPPSSIDKMWLLSIAWEEPYNNSHEVGIAVVEAPGMSGDDTKKYVRIGMFDDRRRPFTWKSSRAQKRKFTIV